MEEPLAVFVSMVHADSEIRDSGIEETCFCRCGERRRRRGNWGPRKAAGESGVLRSSCFLGHKCFLVSVQGPFAPFLPFVNLLSLCPTFESFNVPEKKLLQCTLFHPTASFHKVLSSPLLRCLTDVWIQSGTKKGRVEKKKKIGSFPPSLHLTKAVGGLISGDDSRFGTLSDSLVGITQFSFTPRIFFPDSLFAFFSTFDNRDIRRYLQKLFSSEG